MFNIMGWKIFLSFVFFLMVIFLLAFYWIFPSDSFEFGIKTRNSNFSIGALSGDMQFYPNMRYPNQKISYQIYDCPLQKKNDMERAFDILANKTILNFYPIYNNEEISVKCDSKTRIESNMFIAGEGGPTNITKTDKFSVIYNGEILLIKESQCENPNVAIHELLHALGFKHSNNPDNIMYNFSKCSQTIGDDMTITIDNIYSYPSYADINIENVSAVMHGIYFDVNLTVMNEGLIDSGDAKIKIYADNKMIKELDLTSIGIGYGRVVSLYNIFIKQMSVDELKIVAETDFNELDKTNNEVLLQIKKK